MRKILIAIFSGLMIFIPLRVQAVTTVERTMEMTYVKDGTSNTIQFNSDRFLMSAHGVSSASARKVDFLPLTIMHQVDHVSPILFSLRCSNAEIQEATAMITLRDDQLPDEETQYLIKMKPVYITSYQTGGSADGGTVDEGNVPIELLSLNFEKLDATVRRTLLTGEVLEEVSISCDSVFADGSVHFK
ncbi:MAG: type VI secretion system tube protein Hcp [Candidatus Omnitrophica bacterium]|nr:type VI secretion system tube protein Hcp [Candidatus Omnitrophota bacterium]